jgi:phenylpropionate dioxygenase-like ring-hydroxylating dioxygenase large terminal subunit
VIALHRWVMDHGGVPFPDQPLPPRLEPVTLLERYHSHTKHCRACSGALAAIRRFRPWLAVVPWLALLAVAWRPTLGVLALAFPLALAAWLGGRQLQRWEQLLLQGDGQAPRNRS